MLILVATSAARPQTPAVAVLADTVVDGDAAYRGLLADERAGLLRAMHGDEAPLARTPFAKATFGPGWRRAAKALWPALAGYDFAVAANQAADIALLSGFRGLSADVLARNAAIVEAINREASVAQQRHAIVDAAGATSLFWVPEALGPRLGRAFLHAYEEGDLIEAVALIKASEIGTGPAKTAFAVPRPVARPGNAIRPVMNDLLGADGTPYIAFGAAFPSGHANVGYTDALLLAAMLPERFAALLARADVYAYSRAVLGVHYPLDLIGGRMSAERNVAHFLSDPRYLALFEAARVDLRAALERACGEPLATCAAAADGADPYAAPAFAAFHAFTTGYDLPREGPADAPMHVPEGAEVLLATLRPDLGAASRRDLLARTAAPAGSPLDSADAQAGSWQRLDLYAAARAR